MVYIALLRGINVGAKNIIKMVDLKVWFEELGYRNVTTYVQSGNVVFSAEKAETALISRQIEEKLLAKTGNSIKTIVITAGEMTDVVRKNPFLEESGTEQDKLHVTFLEQEAEPELSSRLEIKAEENSRYVVCNTVIYIYCPDGYGRTKLTNNVFERKLKILATTRNWNTVNHLLEMTEKNVQS